MGTGGVGCPAGVRTTPHPISDPLLRPHPVTASPDPGHTDPPGPAPIRERTWVGDRVGAHEVRVHAEALGLPDTGGADGHRPVRGSPLGPGTGGQAVLPAEHADETGQEPLLGLPPARAVDVIAFCDGPVDHAVTAPPTAAVDPGPRARARSLLAGASPSASASSATA